ncbi:MlaE family ABC transporter permease [Nocardia sp. NPDC051570]|uniref:MlaE family ABC transporter permease n=1 Tax=Nocardia sp. NPDC051570 TaxID=3364324 RepID=UPI0037B341F3
MAESAVKTAPPQPDSPLPRLVEELAHRADSAVRSFGRMVIMAGSGLRHLVLDIARGRFPLSEMLAQAWFVVSVAIVPAILIAIPFGATVSIQVGTLIRQVGATSVAGAAAGLGILRQGAPLVTALLMGGAVASAIAADLGSRSVREEIDALRVIGVDPVQRLVAPRMAAAVLVAPLLCVFVVVTGIVTGYLFNVVLQGGVPGSYFDSFANFVTPVDLAIALIKSTIFGFLVIVIGCHCGLEARGGSKGVALAVNSAVVIGVLTTVAVNAVITELVAQFVPRVV